ncbi:MAG: O-antigen ligase family protein, partial [Candidatus Tectomicrobia bacterium]|nr:O-antigen ligase family protein [Candidatus Tectomicrobia bacterium]
MALRLLDILIELGLIFLIIFAPLPFGSVEPWAYTIIELVAFFLVLLWLLKMLFNPSMHQLANAPISSRINVSTYQRINIIKTSLNFPILLFILIITFQLIPLPPKVIKFLSPNTYEVYRRALPDYDRNLTFTAYRPGYRVVGIGNWKIDLGHPDDYRTISIHPHETQIELFKYLAYIAVFFVVVNNIQTKAQINRLLWAMMFTGSAVALYGLIQYATGAEKIFGFARRYTIEAVNGTYVNKNHFAGLMEMVIPLAIGMGLVAISQSRQSSRKRGSWRKRLLAVVDNPGLHKQLVFFVLAFLMTIGLFFSLSRGGIISFLVSMGFILAMVMVRKSRWRYSLSLTMLMLMIGGISAWIGLDPLVSRFQEISLSSQLADGRWELVKPIVRQINDSPLFGTGSGTFKEFFSHYQPASLGNVFFDHAHNDYLEMAADHGAIALLFFLTLLLFIGRLLKTAMNRRSPYARRMTSGLLAGVVAIGVHSLFDFNLQIPANALYFVFLLALAFTSAHVPETSRRTSRLPSSSARESLISSPLVGEDEGGGKWPLAPKLVTSFIILATVIFLFISTINRYRAERAFQEFQTLPILVVQGPDTPEGVFIKGLEHLSRAVQLDGQNATYYFELAQWLEAPLRTPQFLVSFLSREVDEKNTPPIFDFRLWKMYLKAIDHRILANFAGEAYRQAIRLNPVNADYHLKLGWFDLFKPVYEQRSGYFPYSDSASHAFETALWLKPNFS